MLQWGGEPSNDVFWICIRFSKIVYITCCSSHHKSVAHKFEYDSETIHNVNEYGADFVSTVREGMRNWNMTVQYWLAVFVYKRVPWKKWR